MAESTTTWEEAKKCPICKESGEETYSEPDGMGGKVHTITCKNEGCRWYNTGWLVQVDRKGNIPVRDQGPRGQDKDFPKLSPGLLSMGQRTLEDIVQEDLRNQEKNR